MQTARTPDEEVLALWYELGSLYSSAAGSGQRAIKLGFTVVCVVGALVLLSAPLFGTAWAGPFAPGIPVVAGLLGGGGMYAAERSRVSRRAGVLRRELIERGEDPLRPTRDGLAAYYDAQLVLLRSEYEFLRLRGAKAARFFEATFGFAPEDRFETGPLNVAPDTEAMSKLREGWESRLAERRRGEMEELELGLREDLAFRVFPREMTVPVELAIREGYLAISRRLLVERYGRDPRRKLELMPEALRWRVERDLGEYAALTQRSAPRSRP
ncbi:MAG TPA: hypothetical protein VK869_15205 [Rubrobacteraceae bacterium]|nr:hypothetical protein [Rubrobacteraceae bacterium]